MKKKIITRIIAVVLLFATVVTGGIFFIPNQEVEAVTPKQLRPNVSYRVCSHSSINTGYDGSQGIIQVLTNKGSYSHNHSRGYGITTQGSTARLTIAEAILTKTSSYSETVHVQMVRNRTPYYTWSGNYSVATERLTTSGKRTNTTQSGYGVFNCPDCRLHIDENSGIATVRVPCCNKTVQINSKTGKPIK